jgi:ATP-dependent Clp protease ATP-binding subunit ClpA
MPNKMEQFSQRARRTLSFAQEEAERKQHTYIGPEHLLMGLMREGGGVGARVLRDLGLETQRVEELVDRMTRTGSRVSNAQLDLAPGTKKVLELAVDEARRMGHHYIGTEHLLLGLVRMSDGIAVDVLKRLGVSPEDIRRQTRRVLTETPPFQMAPLPQPYRSSRPADPQGWTLFLTEAAGEAKRLEHNYVGTVHLLIALLRHPRCGDELHSFGIDRERIVGALKDMTTEHPSAQNMEFSPQLITSLGLSFEEVYRSEEAYLREEYLLLGLVRNRQSVAVQILEKLGVLLEDMEKAARDLLTQE